MEKSQRDIMRKPLTKFLSAEEGERIRWELKKHAHLYYTPKHHPEQYLSFLNRHASSFDVNDDQDRNHPYYWTMFSVPSQHVLGDCIEECLDQAIAMEEGRWKNLAPKGTS